MTDFVVGDKVHIDPTYKKAMDNHLWAAMSVDHVGTVIEVEHRPIYRGGNYYRVRWEDAQFNPEKRMHNWGCFGYLTYQIIHAQTKPQRKL